MDRIELGFGQAVRVYWEDITNYDGWAEPENDQNDPGGMVSIGYVIKSAERALVLSHTISTTKHSYSKFCIPWGAIVRVETLPVEYARGNEIRRAV